MEIHRGFKDLPREVQDKLSRKILSKDDVLFCIINTRAKKYLWLAEILWEKLLELEPIKEDFMFLMEYSPALGIKACYEFLIFSPEPTASELRYIKIYTGSEAIKEMLKEKNRRRIAVASPHEKMVSSRNIPAIHPETDVQQIAVAI